MNRHLLPNPEPELSLGDEMRVRLHLSRSIGRLMREKGIHQIGAAAKSGMSQADISRIVNGRVNGYSVWRLAKVLSDLGADAKLVFDMPSGESEEVHL